MSVSARRTASDRSSPMAETSFEQSSVIGFKGAQAGVEQIAFGDDDDVEPARDLVTTKNLSNQSFSSISLNRAADLPGRRNPEPSHTPLVGQHEQRAIAAVGSNSPIVDLLELRTPADMFGWTESHRINDLSLFAAHGETLAPLRPTPFQHEAAVLRAHANQEPVCALTMARIGLKSTDTL
jgi:hypothetical protein